MHIVLWHKITLFKEPSAALDDRPILSRAERRPTNQRKGWIRALALDSRDVFSSEAIITRCCVRKLQVMDGGRSCHHSAWFLARAFSTKKTPGQHIASHFRGARFGTWALFWGSFRARSLETNLSGICCSKINKRKRRGKERKEEKKTQRLHLGIGLAHSAFPRICYQLSIVMISSFLTKLICSPFPFFFRAPFPTSPSLFP